jgi:aspartate 1-decarboxylase
MPEPSKTLRHLLLGTIHRAVVTRADLDSAGSISIDEELMEAAGFLAHEKVDIYDVTNGARLATSVVPTRRGSGEVGISGAAAHLVRPGDLVIIASYGWMKEKAARRHHPRIVHVDQENRPLDVSQSEPTQPQDPFGHLAACAVGALDQDEQDMGLDADEPPVDSPLVVSPLVVSSATSPGTKKKGRGGKKQKKQETA